ncbi:hypothetical protein [Marinobacter salarius]|uniref:DUF4870 domain-containing protein n=1 Tax=Marinobacter salarius TaxID=1420917 RepID=A0A1W6KFJ5_9GAMM|nr:hypothetical protein [Marinobacter salarius]ARM86173.1 hypothetical protein MARSALSMR5_04153 [Marinobacter salarius]
MTDPDDATQTFKREKRWAHTGYAIQTSSALIGGLPLIISVAFSYLMTRRLGDPIVRDHLAAQKRNSIIVFICLVPFILVPRVFALESDATATGAYIIFGSLYGLAGLWLTTQIILGWYRACKNHPARKPKKQPTGS